MLTINGSNFVSGTGLTVTVGGAPVTPVTWVSAAKLTVVTPSGAAGAQAVVVTNPDGQASNADVTFRYLLPPTLSTVTPVVGTRLGGTLVTIVGANFEPDAAIMVTVNGVSATSVTWASATTITAKTPAGSTGTPNLIVTVTNPGTSAISKTVPFTYVRAATLISVTPSSGTHNGGTTITITGSGFASIATVTVGGNAASSVVVSPDGQTITAVTPPGSVGGRSVIVRQESRDSNSITFTYS
jgi:hypothetical protein